MIDSPTVTTDHDDGVDAGPLVTLPSDVASGPAMTDRARLLAALDGLDPAGSVQVGWLISFLRRLGSDPTVELAFDGTTASLPPRAMTLRSVALRCGRSPGTVGAWQRTWRQLGLVEAGPPPAVNVARLCETCSVVPTAAPVPDTDGASAALELPVKTAGSEGEKLDVLLGHLRLAAADGDEVTVGVITGLAFRLVESAAREAARPAQSDPLVREIDRSLDTLSLPSEARDARLETEPVARPTGQSSGRSAPATLKLLAPLLEAVDRFGLAPLTDREALARALRPYSDEQILRAQSVLLRQCNTQRNITSPIGLLVRHAQQGSPEYFELPPPPPPTPEPRPPDDSATPLRPEQRAAAQAKARDELAKADGPRRPVHRAKLHTAA